MVLSTPVKDQLHTILAALNTADTAINGLVTLSSQETGDDQIACDVLLREQDFIQEHISKVELLLGVTIEAAPSLAIASAPASMLPLWDVTWQRAWDIGDPQVELTVGDQTLIVRNATNIHKPALNDFVFMCGIMQQGNLTYELSLHRFNDVFAYFASHELYGVTAHSAWHHALDGAVATWDGAWAAADKWNSTHDADFRCDQIQALGDRGHKEVLLCVNRVAGGLYDPGYYAGGAIVTTKTAIEKEAIAAWYGAAHIDFRFTLAWKPALVV